MMPEQNYPERRRNNLSEEYIAEILSRLEGLENQIGECSKRINVRIDERMSEHSAIRSMQAEIKVLTLGFEELKGIVKGAIGNGDRRLKDHDQEIEQLALRITGLENAVSEINAKISQIEHIGRSNTEAINSLSSQMMRHNTAVLDSMNNLQSAINAVSENQSKNVTAKGAVKSPFVWTAGGIILIIHAVAGIAWYILTGDTTLLDSAK